LRLFGGGATSLSRDDSVTLTSTGGKTTSNGLSSFSNCSISAAVPATTAATDDDDDYDVTTLARCFRLPRDVIQTRQLPKPPPPPPPPPQSMLPPYQPQYPTGVLFILLSIEFFTKLAASAVLFGGFA